MSATAAERGRMMRRLGDLIAQRAREVAAVESMDNGKLIRETVWIELTGATRDPFNLA
jgi:acyl-CoA reductase-like NAD-dependent aldehyde dehydrogenase